MVKEVDPINHKTKGAMTDTITSMIQKGSSKNEGELKSRLIELETRVKKFVEKTTPRPDPGLLASV